MPGGNYELSLVLLLNLGRLALGLVHLLFAGNDMVVQWQWEEGAKGSMRPGWHCARFTFSKKFLGAREFLKYFV